MIQWYKFKELWSPFSSKTVSVYASSVSYYVLLSLIPTALLLFSLFSTLTFSEAWMAVLQHFLPAPLWDLTRQILTYIHEQNTINLLSFSSLMALWSASKALLALRHGINIMVDAYNDERYLARRIKAFILLMITMGLLFTIAIVLLWSSSFFSALHSDKIRSYLPIRISIRYLSTQLVLFLVFTIVFYYLPERKLRLRSCLIGSTFSSFIWMLLSWIFSIYIQHISSYAEFYGTLGLILLALIWMHICTKVILYGSRLCFLIDQDLYHPIQILKSIFFW